MAQKVRAAKITLSYPVYACAFDPQDPRLLTVGGGGGAGRSGVGNKITVLDTSNPHELSESIDIDLSKDEDNVTSLYMGPQRGSSTLIYAGVNSSPKDVARGKNEHFRIFELPSREKTTRKIDGHISELSRTALFRPRDKDAYQRTLRLSSPYNNLPQLGAVATGLAKESEIVLFDTADSNATIPTIRGHILLSQEPEDLDIIQNEEKAYLFAYCSRRVIFLQTISSAAAPAPQDPRIVYTTPVPDDTGNHLAQSFRCIRFLNKEFVLTLTNIDQRRGVILQVLRLPKNDKAEARIASQIRLPSQVAQATGVAVCNLTPPSSPGVRTEQSQFVIAVAGHDRSIYLYTLEYTTEMSVSQVSNFKLRATIKEVHPLQITGLSFSNFIPPTTENSSETLKLASVSVGNTVVVHTIRLKTTSSIKSKTPVYIADIPAPPRSSTLFALMAFAVILLAILTQGVMEIRGSSPAYFGATKYVSPFWQKALRPVPGVPGIYDEIKNGILRDPTSVEVSTSPTSLTPVSSAPQYTASSFSVAFAKLVAEQQQGSSNDQRVIFIREEQDAASHETSPGLASSIKADLHDEALQGPHGGKRWEELDEEQKLYWASKLRGLGHEVEDFGGTVLKGVVFGGVRGAIGQAVAG
ncbi:MAG: hypothetical protein M1818_000210 [Claussenomyces sp. TS43310]|nr:MAG: hypothetical protein M1818_000210 [Claussenomyces sp. TS43310]